MLNKTILLSENSEIGLIKGIITQSALLSGGELKVTRDGKEFFPCRLDPYAGSSPAGTSFLVDLKVGDILSASSYYLRIDFASGISFDIEGFTGVTLDAPITITEITNNFAIAYYTSRLFNTGGTN